MTLAVAKPTAWPVVRVIPAAARGFGVALTVAKPTAGPMVWIVPAAARRFGVALAIAEPAALSHVLGVAATIT
jgi:hypothetical protein